MSNSKRRQILEYLRDTTLAAISVGNGYNTTPGTIKRGLFESDSPADSQFPAIFITATNEERQNISKVHFQSRMQVHLEGYVRNGTGVSGLQANIDDLVEDVTKAIEQDRTLGGLAAKHLEIKNVKTDEADYDAIGAMLMIVEVMYVTEGTAP